MNMNEFEVEELILQMADIVRSKRELEDENFYLREKLKQEMEMHHRSYNEATNRVAALLNGAIERCDSQKTN